MAALGTSILKGGRGRGRCTVFASWLTGLWVALLVVVHLRYPTRAQRVATTLLDPESAERARFLERTVRRNGWAVRKRRLA